MMDLSTGGIWLHSVSSDGKWRSGRVEARLVGFVFAAPLVVLLVAVLIYPIGNLIYLSLTNTRIVGAPSTLVGLGNYTATLQSSAFWNSVGRSALWLFGNVALSTGVAFGAALLLRQPWRPATQARVWILLPWVIPTVAVAVIFQWMLNANYGVINYALQSLHVISQPLNVFGSKELALPGLIVANTWHWFPLSAVVMFGAMQTIPRELYEAAQIDGATGWQQFRFVTLPAIEKTLFALGLVGGLWTLNVFDMIYLITKGGPLDATLTLPAFIYDTAFKAQRIGLAAAISVIAIVLVAIAAILYARLAGPKEDHA